MFKKLILVAVVGGLAIAAFKGTKWASYARQELRELREAAEGQIPPEKEVARLRAELKLLDNDIMKVVNQLAKERVECERLKDQVADLRGKQSQAKELITARAAAIKEAEASAATFVSFGDRKVGLTSAKIELSDAVARYTNNQKSLDSLDATLAARSQIKEQLEKQLEELKNQKLVLANEVDALEAELNRLNLEQMKSKYQTDNSRLAKIKEDMRALKMKVDIEREKLKLMPVAFDEPATTSPAASKSVDDIIAPVTGTKPAAKPANPQLPMSQD
jgi:DNA repair exonuclease SbcCD ATPase subunit